MTSAGSFQGGKGELRNRLAGAGRHGPERLGGAGPPKDGRFNQTDNDMSRHCGNLCFAG